MRLAVLTIGCRTFWSTDSGPPQPAQPMTGADEVIENVGSPAASAALREKFKGNPRERSGGAAAAL